MRSLIRKHKKSTIALLAALLLSIAFIAGCSAKQREQYQDSPRTGVTNNLPADLINMPDGFSNLATKCDHGNRIYVVFHNNSAYASGFAVANAPGCQGS